MSNNKNSGSCSQSWLLAKTTPAIRAASFLTPTHPNSETGVNAIKYSNIRFPNRNLNRSVAIRKVSEKHRFAALIFSPIDGKMAGF